MKKLLPLFFVALYAAYSTNSLADDAYTFGAVYTGEYWSNLDGGIEEGEVYLDIFDLTLEVDTEKAFNWKGGTFFGYVFYTNSNTLTDTLVGDAQGVSNIDNTNIVRIMELWYEQAFGTDKSLKFGLYDLNSEFDVMEPAGLFINSSHGIGADFSQSGKNGPSIFPVGSLALRYFQQINSTISFQVAILDAFPGDPDDEDINTIHLGDGALYTGEVNYNNDRQRFGLGSWYYSRETETLDGNSKEHNMGVYAIAEHKLLNMNDDGKDLSVFLRYGVAEESINQFGSYLGTGIVYSNFSAARPDDSIGFAIANAINGDDYRNTAALEGDRSTHNEVNFELTYSAKINEYLTIQPDIQYIRNTGTDPDRDDALVVGIRFEITLL